MSNELLAQALRELLAEAFGSGFTSPETYNDTVFNSAVECWAKERDHFFNRLNSIISAAHEALAAVPVEPPVTADDSFVRLGVKYMQLGLPKLEGLPFVAWCSSWFGPDSDEVYLAKAVGDLLGIAHPAPQPQQPGVALGVVHRYIRAFEQCADHVDTSLLAAAVRSVAGKMRLEIAATPPQPTAPAPQAQAQPITEAEAIKLWHGDKEAHRRESAFEWYAAGLIAAQHHYGIATPASAAQKEPT